MVDLTYVDVGLLLLPKPIYRDDRGNLYRYDVSWEKRERMNDREELERLLKIHKILPKTIEGEVEFDNRTFLGIKDKKGNLYRFEKMPSGKSPRSCCEGSSVVEHPAVSLSRNR